MSRKLGRGYCSADLEVAASNYATLATRNTADFDHLGLNIANP